jgi:hypothetical protein
MTDKARELREELESIQNEQDQMLMQCRSTTERRREIERADAERDRLIAAALSAAREEERASLLRRYGVWIEAGLEKPGRTGGDGNYSSAYTKCRTQGCEYEWREYGGTTPHSEHCICHEIAGLSPEGSTEGGE